MFLKNNKGFTLLEALIGFFVLSVGMLGIASLQAISLKAGKTSVYGSVAMMKVSEIVESMRINSSALASYVGSGSGADNSCSGTTNCTPAQLAQDDVFWWKENLEAGLPNTADTTTLITLVTAPVPPSAMATMQVDVSWNERDKNSSSPVTKTTTTTVHICTALPC